MLSKIFLNFVWTSKLKVSKTSLEIHEIPLNILRNTLNYMCDLDPLSKVGHIIIMFPYALLVLEPIMLWKVFLCSWAVLKNSTNIA